MRRRLPACLRVATLCSRPGASRPPVVSWPPSGPFTVVAPVVRRSTRTRRGAHADAPHQRAVRAGAAEHRSKASRRHTHWRTGRAQASAQDTPASPLHKRVL
jgi:hypothetical protein